MTDYRDPNYRDPSRPEYRDPSLSEESQAWSNATWGWIAGISVVVLILVFAFGSGTDGNRTATDTSSPPSTIGQRTPAPPPGGPVNEAPTMNRPAPAPTPMPNPAPDAR
jgi:hypothetical protein